MPGDADARVIAQAAENARRQAELEKRHRDLTKPVPPVGSDGDSLRGVKGFEGITDEILEERANFNLRSMHTTQTPVGKLSVPNILPINLRAMTAEELHALAGAALTEFEQRTKENRNA